MDDVKFDLDYPKDPDYPAPGRNRAERRRYASLMRKFLKGSAGRGQTRELKLIQAQLARAAAVTNT